MTPRQKPHHPLAPCAVPLTQSDCVLAKAAAKEAVAEVFSLLGTDVRDPKQVEEFRQDLRFGGSMRKTWEKGVIAGVAVVTGGCLAALWAGITMHAGGSQ